MNIAVIGAGHVGLVTAACLAKLGHRVTVVDADPERVAEVRQGRSPIYEPGVEELLSHPNLEVAEDLGEAVSACELTFICVSTGDSRTCATVELSAVSQVARDIGRAINSHHLVVVKSTVPPGSTERVLVPLLESSGKRWGSDFAICVNPEFLQEGDGVRGFLNPYRIIIGEGHPGDGDPLAEIYRPLPAPQLRVDLKTAEMTKFAANAFLATRLSLINEIGNICKRLGVDVYQVARGIGYDPRIGAHYLGAGLGFGGSCLPKDLKALSEVAYEAGHEPVLLPAVERVNQEQPREMLLLLKKHLPTLRGRTVGVLGLAFKPGTGDSRQSPALEVIRLLLAEGVQVRACDPQAVPAFRRLFPAVEYTSSQQVLDSDAVLIVTAWEEFSHLDYRGKVVIDGRRVDKAREAHIYEGLCW